MTQQTREANNLRERGRNIAAFFDLDGTLIALPSLERRFYRMLKYRKEISLKSCFLWLREVLRLLPRGINTILQANKMYLLGVPILDETSDGHITSGHKDGHAAEGQASAPPRRNPRLPVPAFFAEAIDRVAWHANQGHEIVLVSGALEPLAREAARRMENELVERGITAKIRVCATRLEEKDGRWTGRILGEAMFGEEKARAAKRLATEIRLTLELCYAYGDSFNDRRLLAVVGKPTAVNPSKGLARFARTRLWPVLNWNGKETQSPGDKRLRAQRDCRMQLAKPEIFE